MSGKVVSMPALFLHYKVINSILFNQRVSSFQRKIKTRSPGIFQLYGTASFALAP
ncbi:MAG: hypothetical protein ACQPRJ_01740 [Solitalea-like symbiont of Acarus siro]